MAREQIDCVHFVVQSKVVETRKLGTKAKHQSLDIQTFDKMKDFIAATHPTN